MYAVLSLAGLCVPAVPAREEKRPDPTGAPPTIQFVSAVDAAQATITVLRGEPVKVAVQITTASGLRLETADAFKRLKPGMAIVVSADGKAVSPAFLSIVQPETLVLPPLAAPAPPPMPRPLVLPKVKV